MLRNPRLQTGTAQRRLSLTVSVVAPSASPIKALLAKLNSGFSLEMGEVGASLRDSFRQTFAQGGRPTTWKPLAPSTIAQKQELGALLGYPYATKDGRQRVRRLAQLYHGQMNRSVTNVLIATGALRDSCVQKGAKDHVSRTTPFSQEEGTTNWLGVLHHEGGDRSYTITAKNKKVLKFMGGNGKWRFRRSVTHPPLPARPILVFEDSDIQKVGDRLTKPLMGES